MALSNLPVFPQKPKRFAVSIGHDDVQNWKFLSSNGIYSCTDGTKVVSLIAASTDTSARDVQVGIARSSVVTITIATPGVVSWTGHDFVAGDQVVFQTTGALPTGLTAGTTYFVIAAGLTPGVSFQVSASAGGAAVNTSGSQSGVHTGWIVRIKGTVAVPITAGSVSGTPSVDLLNSTQLPGLAVDNDGQRYIPLEGNNAIVLQALTTVTANKIINIGSAAADFS